METEQLLELIKAVSESNLTGFKYEEKGVKLSLQKESLTKEHILQEKVAIPESVLSEVLPEKREEKEGNIVKSPLVGTFYAAPSEDAEPFVRVGDQVKKGQVLVIVEAMKLMNEIESEYSGEITEIYVENGEAVEYGQPLFKIC